MTGAHTEMCPRTGFKPVVSAVTELYAIYMISRAQTLHAVIKLFGVTRLIKRATADLCHL